MLVLKDHEHATLGPEKMIHVPPRHYCIVRNPAIVEDGEPVLNDYGEVKVHFGELEIRHHHDWQHPFSLYPYEVLEQDITAYQVVNKKQALKLECIRPFHDEKLKVDRFPTD